MFKIDVKGLDGLRSNLKELSSALQNLDGTLTTIRFDPSDALSIESAISEARRAIDERLFEFVGNPWVEKLKENLKDQFVREIDERAQKARSANLGA